MILVPAVVVGDDVLGRSVTVGGLEAQAERIQTRKIVDLVGRTDAQRLPPELPGTARARAAIEHDEVVSRVETEPLQVVRDGQPGLPRADHHY